MPVETIYEQNDGSIISEVTSGKIDSRHTTVSIHSSWEDYREHYDHPSFIPDMKVASVSGTLSKLIRRFRD